MSRAQPTSSTGKRKLSDEHRAKLAEAGRRQYANLTPEQKAAQAARIGRKPKPGAAASSTVSTPAVDDPPKPAGEGRRNPLAMTPGELVRSLLGRQ